MIPKNTSKPNPKESQLFFAIIVLALFLKLGTIHKIKAITASAKIAVVSKLDIIVHAISAGST